MLRPVAILAATLLAAIAAFSSYLAWRIASERACAPKAVAAILASMDPATDTISDGRIAALLRIEDPTFWTNDGIDLSTPGAGQTTFAQGLGKRLFFRRFDPGPLKLGKVELMALTRFALIPTTSKKDILRAALATAYLGRDDQGPINGFADGARRWFGKEISTLDDDEFLALAAMLPAPNRLTPGTTANTERVGRIKRLLAGACAPQSNGDVYFEACAS